MQLAQVFGARLLLQGFEEHLVEAVLIAGSKHVGERQLPARLAVEVHRQVLVDAVGATLVVVEVDVVYRCALVAQADVGSDDVVVLIPGALEGVGTVLIVEGQVVLLVVGCVLGGKGVYGLLHLQVFGVEQPLLDGVVDNLRTVTIVVGGIVELQVYAAAGRVVVVRQYDGLVCLYLLEVYGPLLLAGAAGKQCHEGCQ